MAKQEKQPHGGTLTRPDKGETMNPYGRPKKLKTILKAQGYSLSQINDCISIMISMTLDQLKEIYTNPQATILEKTIAHALKKSLDKGNLYSVETLLTRVFGKPKETISGDKDNPIKVEIIEDKYTTSNKEF